MSSHLVFRWHTADEDPQNTGSNSVPYPPSYNNDAEALRLIRTGLMGAMQVNEKREREPSTDLEETLDPLAGSHDGGGEDPGEPAGHAQLHQVELGLGVAALLQLLADPEAHEAQCEDGRHAHDGGAHSCKKRKKYELSSKFCRNSI